VAIISSENFPPPRPPKCLTEFEQSHAELLAALIVAGKEIARLNFGRKDSPLLVKLRSVLRDARIAAKSERAKVRASYDQFGFRHLAQLMIPEHKAEAAQVASIALLTDERRYFLGLARAAGK
jgi:hypothetical protein